MIRIARYEDRWSGDFERLNREWIEHYFSIEPEDLTLFADLRGEVIEPGGEILLALEGDVVVGTVALLPHGAQTYELAKMSVTPSAQGRGIGRQLVQAAVEAARRAGKSSMFLLTNSRLGPAVHLYESVGFRVVPQGESRYKRVDMVMELRFDRSP